MTDEQKEKIVNSHRYFSSSCFNAVWDLIDKNQKTKEEIETMIHLTHTSFWHWTEVPEVTPTNLSVGYWQLSRVYALVGNGKEALYYGNRSLEVSLENRLEPFYIGYSYEAITRAYEILHETALKKENLDKAMEHCEKITEEENKNLLKSDLDVFI